MSDSFEHFGFRPTRSAPTGWLILSQGRSFLVSGRWRLVAVDIAHTERVHGFTLSPIFEAIHCLSDAIVKRRILFLRELRAAPTSIACEQYTSVYMYIAVPMHDVATAHVLSSVCLQIHEAFQFLNAR